MSFSWISCTQWDQFRQVASPAEGARTGEGCLIWVFVGCQPERLANAPGSTAGSNRFAELGVRVDGLRSFGPEETARVLAGERCNGMAAFQKPLRTWPRR
jgi:hypothetical protein